MSYINLGEVRGNAEVISAEHFGLNFVANYERIGDQPWETYDETVERIGSQNLRYPGGSFSEQYFDLRNPNRTEYTASDGSVQQIEPLHDFLAYCESIQARATITIPTRVLLTNGSNGSRDFNESWSQDIYDFVYETLSVTGGTNIHMFELGNEYESYMTSSEYGKVASRLAEIVQDAINSFSSDNGLNGNWTEPLIAVQTWSFNVQNSLTLEEQSLRNQAVMDQFSPDQIQAVDAIVSHYYHDNNRYLGLPNEQSYGNLEAAVVESIEMLQDWEARFGRDFEILYTEWSTFHGSQELLGLAQLPAVIGLFDAMTGNGVNGMHFWSAQYHASSAALGNGTLTAVGALLSFMQTELVGYQSIEITSDVSDVEFAGFARDDQLVLFISSISESSTTVMLDDRANFLGYEIIGSQTIGVDISEADGEYRNLTGLDFYMEPDLPGFLTDFSVPDGWSNGLESLSFSPYQTIILSLERFETTLNQATNGNDNFVFEPNVRKFIGLGGFDTILLTNANVGQMIDLINDTAPDGTAMFEGIEGLVGTALDDTLRGNDADNALDGSSGDDILVGRNGNDSISGGSGNDVVYGGNGDDILNGGSGADELFGQAGNDTLQGGNGDDLIHAGAGDDYIIYVGGQDTIDGESGRDILDFSGSSDSVSMWGSSAIAEVVAGRISVDGIEQFIFGAGDDRFDVSWEGGTVASMGGGEDFVTMSSDGNQIELGDGDDLVYHSGFSNKIDGGSGNDKFFSFSGSMTVSGGAGDDIFSLGDSIDILIFSNGDGDDKVLNFDRSSDSLALDADLLAVADAGTYSINSHGNGTTLNFGGNYGTIHFYNLNTADVALILDGALELQTIDFF